MQILLLMHTAQLLIRSGVVFPFGKKREVMLCWCMRLLLDPLSLSVALSLSLVEKLPSLQDTFPGICPGVGSGKHWQEIGVLEEETLLSISPFLSLPLWHSWHVSPL